MDVDQTLNLQMMDTDGTVQLKMRINPYQRFGDDHPSLLVEITCEEPETNNVRIKTLWLSEFDYRQYNWLGMLRQIFNELEDRDIQNDYELAPEHMTSPPRTRWLPPLGDWRGALRRQLGR